MIHGILFIGNETNVPTNTEVHKQNQKFSLLNGQKKALQYSKGNFLPH